jgi:hypothetical protein
VTFRVVAQTYRILGAGRGTTDTTEPDETPAQDKEDLR